MMKLLLLAMLLVTTMLTTPLAGESIKDSFDDDVWTVWCGTEAQTNMIHNYDVGKDRAGCAELEFKRGNNLKSSNVFYKNFKLTAGKNYRISIFAKGEKLPGNTILSLSAQGIGKDNKFLGVINDARKTIKNDVWQKLDFDFMVPDYWDSPDLQVRCLLGASGAESGSVYFDDFGLEEIDLCKGYQTGFDNFKWASWKSDKAIGEFLHNNAEGHTAPGALEMKIGPGNPLDTSLTFLIHLPVIKGKTYHFSAYVKNKSIPDRAVVSLTIQAQTAKKEFLGPLEGTSIPAVNCKKDWKLLEFTFQVPESGAWKNAEFVLLCLGVSKADSGEFLLDDFSFAEAK